MKKIVTAIAIAAASLTAQAEGFYVGGGVGYSALKNELYGRALGGLGSALSPKSNIFG
jgi:hypothetical protein